MKLITKEIEAKLPRLYSNESNPDPVAVVKFFTPWSNWTWYATEGERHDDAGGGWLFFGLVKGLEEALGYFQLAELESVRGPFGLRIERDLHFRPTPLSELRTT